MSSTARDIAAALVAARRDRTALVHFPGVVPDTLEDAYAIQRDAIDQIGTEVAGWKVGRVTGARQDRFGVDRFIGPVFRHGVVQAQAGEDSVFPLFAGGSAAFEAEYVHIAARDLDPDDAAAGIGAVVTGIEVAGSPVAELPQLGPLASIADLGNNNGQILGAAVPRERWWQDDRLTCSVAIDDAPVASRTAAALPGGPRAALAFAAAQAVRLGLPIRAGQFVSTGAVTGMHAAVAGQRMVADFGASGRLACVARVFPPTR